MVDVPAEQSCAKPLSERLATVQSKPRQYKYGFCDRHNCALEIRVQIGGRFPGQPVARCPMWKQRTADSKPLCWASKVYTGPHETLPKSIRKQILELKKDLRWSLKYGPSAQRG